jgi:GNAT superfamily N-acetyltransferase
MPEHPIEAGEKRPANLTELQRELAEMAAQTSGRLSVTIRPCRLVDFETIHAIINDAAQAYRGVIPADCWKAPYMSREALRHEIAEGVVFWGGERDAELAGVMGAQEIMDVTLIRHAYVRTAARNQGIGGKVLAELLSQTTRPTLVGTWAAAEWAVRFYQRHGFRLVSPEEKDRLLRTYWSITDRQIETSVVLADERWWARWRESSDDGGRTR